MGTWIGGWHREDICTCSESDLQHPHGWNAEHFHYALISKSPCPGTSPSTALAALFLESAGGKEKKKSHQSSTNIAEGGNSSNGQGISTYIPTIYLRSGASVAGAIAKARLNHRFSAQLSSIPPLYERASVNYHPQLGPARYIDHTQGSELGCSAGVGYYISVSSVGWKQKTEYHRKIIGIIDGTTSCLQTGHALLIWYPLWCVQNCNILRGSMCVYVCVLCFSF